MSGRYGAKQRGRRVKEKHRGSQGERNERVGGRQGKSAREREDVEMKERTREERQSARERAKCQTDK